MSLDETVPDMEIPAAAKRRWASDRTVADLPVPAASWRERTLADATPPDAIPSAIAPAFDGGLAAAGTGAILTRRHEITAPDAVALHSLEGDWPAGGITPPDGVAAIGGGKPRGLDRGADLPSPTTRPAEPLPRWLHSLGNPLVANGGNGRRLGLRSGAWIGCVVFVPVAVLTAVLASSAGRSAAAPAPEALWAEGPSAPILFEAALDAIRDDGWDEAIRLLERGAALDPSREEIARYLESARQERLAAEAVADARRCLEEGDGACAEAALGRVPPESLVTERHVGALRERLATVTEPDESHEDARAFAGSSMEVGAKADLSKLESSLRHERGAARVKPASRRIPGAGAPTGVAARRQASPGGAPRGPAAIDEGSRSRGGALAAVRMVQAGVRARLSDDLELAAERFSQALVADPANAAARAELDALRGRLPEIFRRAYARMEGEPERAARGMRLVARLAPAGDPLRGKAEKWLARLPAGSAR